MLGTPAGRRHYTCNVEERPLRQVGTLHRAGRGGRGPEKLLATTHQLQEAQITVCKDGPGYVSTDYQGSLGGSPMSLIWLPGVLKSSPDGSSGQVLRYSPDPTYCCHS